MAAQDHLGRQWEQIPLIHTPKELKKVAHSLLDGDHEELGYTTKWGKGNVVQDIGEYKDSASGECDGVCRDVGPFLPHGSHMVRYHDDDEYDHYVHHVPTTEGLHVVDYTQRQFNNNASFPVVEHEKKFSQRKSMRNLRHREIEEAHFDAYNHEPK
jgi:hypothetical protein